jgi:hypothetical protein
MVASYSPLAAVRLFNNVFYGIGDTLFDVFDGAGLVLNGNAYWTGSERLTIQWDTGTAAPRALADFASYRDATGQEAGGVNVDPLLMAAGDGPTLHDPSLLETLDAYALQANSPLRNHGVDLRKYGIDPGPRDFSGNAALSGDGFDIGACEQQ